MGPFHRDQLLLLRPQNSIFGGRQIPQHINGRLELIPDPEHTQSDFFGCHRRQGRFSSPLFPEHFWSRSRFIPGIEAAI